MSSTELIPSDTRAYSVEGFRKKHPRAYEKWSEQDDKLLFELLKSGGSLEQLCIVLQRGKGAIKSRIHKLKPFDHVDKSDFRRINHLFSEFSFDWTPVLRSEDEHYHFPAPLTSYMTRLYKSPEIYRWNVYKNTPTDLKVIYIGEGQQLIPNRIKGYLNPGPSQATNRRLNGCLSEYIQTGHKVLLEIVRFDTVTIGEFSFGPENLHNKHFRRFLEHFLITYFQKERYTMLNL